MNNDEKKGLAFSVLFHIVCCALVGLLVLTNFHTFPEEPVYDVALVGGGDAAPEVAQPEPEPEPRHCRKEGKACSQEANDAKAFREAEIYGAGWYRVRHQAGN